MATPTHILPCLDFTKDPNTLEPGSPEWSKMCSTLREVLEKNGGVIVKYDRIPEGLLDKMFAVLPRLFDLPVETKRKNESPIPYEKYIRVNSSYEALKIYDTEFVEEARAFTRLMWPDGNDEFCQTMNILSRGLLELIKIVGRMVCDSYGAGRHYSQVESMRNLFFISRYQGNSHPGSVPHTDRSFLTVVLQNDVDGLHFKTREGDWFPLHLSNGHFAIVAGQLLQAWSNERIFAVDHEVLHSGDKDRLSCGLFLSPKENIVMKAPEELSDNGQLPLFKPITSVDNSESILSGKFMEAPENGKTYA